MTGGLRPTKREGERLLTYSPSHFSEPLKIQSKGRVLKILIVGRSVEYFALQSTCTLHVIVQSCFELLNPLSTATAAFAQSEQEGHCKVKDSKVAEKGVLLSVTATLSLYNIDRALQCNFIFDIVTSSCCNITLRFLAEFAIIFRRPPPPSPSLPHLEGTVA